jgi:hypothetical protein
MEKKNFYFQVKTLHNEIVAEIKKVMLEHNKAVVDLAGSPAPHAFVIGSPAFDPELGSMDAEVLKVILEDGKIKFDINWDMDSDYYLEQYPNWNEDIGDLYEVVDADDFDKLVPCAGISSVYESVWEYLTYGYKGDNDEDLK